MSRLSMPIENLKQHYGLLVIGSGYGASIAASRLARAGQQVCVLERGKEFQPGEYPDTEIKALEEIQAELPEAHLGSRTGLYEFNVNEEMNVFKGCELGGTSLVDANVALRAEPRVFQDPRWPQPLRDDLDTLVKEGYEHAEEMLKPTTYPADGGYPVLPKLQAQEQSAKSIGATCYRTPINVSFTLAGPNHVGVEQHPCSCCGDCVRAATSLQELAGHELPARRQESRRRDLHPGGRTLDRTRKLGLAGSLPDPRNRTGEVPRPGADG